MTENRDLIVIGAVMLVIAVAVISLFLLPDSPLLLLFPPHPGGAI